MKQLLLILTVMALVGCGESKEEKAAPKTEAKSKATKLGSVEQVKKNESAMWVSDQSDPNNVDIEREIRIRIGKFTGELTKVDLQKVTSLYLAGTRVTDAGLKEVAKLKNLEVLQLEGAQISDAGLEQVAKLKGLEYLLLVGTRVTAVGVAELQKALPKCTITSNPTK